MDLEELALLVLNRIGSYCNHIHVNASSLGFSFQNVSFCRSVINICSFFFSFEYVDFCANETQFAGSFTVLLQFEESC